MKNLGTNPKPTKPGYLTAFVSMLVGMLSTPVGYVASLKSFARNPRRFVTDVAGEAGAVQILMAVLVAIVIFAALAPVVADLVGDGGNLTGGARALYLLTPLFFVIVGVLLILRYVTHKE